MSVTPLPVSGPNFPSPDQPWRSSAALGDTIRAMAATLLGHSTADPGVAGRDDETWRTHLRRLLRPLREAFAEHRAVTEGDQGLYAEMVQEAPRLASTVHGLVAEHHLLDSAIARLAAIADEVSADAELLRRGALQVLDDLARHRQLDADLVYEAYATDIGGE